MSISASARLWRSLGTAAWLGWQIEANWATPLVFAVYAILKPLALAGILVVMYATITNADFAAPAFAYLYLGNAFYLYVGAVMSGMAWAVLDDRERYRTLKTVYVAPIDLRLYLIGRGVARFATGSISVAILLVVGVAAFELPIRPGAVNWPLFVGSLLAGLVMLAAMGLLIASLVLLLTQFAWSLGDAVAGALFLFSGAVFPLDILPAPLQPVGYALPLVYWLELIRRALAPSLAGAFPLAALSTWTLCGLLALLTGALAATALVVFHRCDHLARERGLIDRTSNY